MRLQETGAEFLNNPSDEEKLSFVTDFLNKQRYILVS